MRILAALSMIFLAQSQLRAEVTRMGLERQKGDIQRVSLTEFRPGGRTVILDKPADVAGFARQFERWSLDDRSEQRFTPDDFRDLFSPLYIFTLEENGSKQTVYFVSNHIQRQVNGRLTDLMEFTLLRADKDAGFSMYLQDPAGAERPLFSTRISIEK
jgi:hypothetical protein